MFLLPSLAGGGAERFAVNLLRHIDRSRFQLSLLIVNASDDKYRCDIPADVNVIALNKLRVRSAIPNILLLIWQYKPDVVFSVQGHLSLPLALFRFLLPRKLRMIAYEASIVSAFIGKGLAAFFWRLLYKNFYGQFDLVVCQSFLMQEDLVNNFRLNFDKTTIIFNPVDVERILALSRQTVDDIEIAENSISFVAVGRLSVEKGFDILIGAIAKLNRKDIILTIVGEGPLLHDLQVQIEALGLQRQIYFTGFLSNPFPLMAKADALILSSHFEGMPNVVLEALACGTQVLATPAIGGLFDIAEHTGAIRMAKSIDSIALSELIAEYISVRANERFSPDLSEFLIGPVTRKYESVFLNADTAEASV